MKHESSFYEYSRGTVKITSLEEIDRHFLPSFAVLMPPFQARLMQMRTTSSPPFNRLPFNSFHFLGEILSDVSNTHARARYFTIIHLAKWIQTGCRVKHARQQSRLPSLFLSGYGLISMSHVIINQACYT